MNHYCGSWFIYSLKSVYGMDTTIQDNEIILLFWCAHNIVAILIIVINTSIQLPGSLWNNTTILFDKQYKKLYYNTPHILICTVTLPIHTWSCMPTAWSRSHEQVYAQAVWDFYGAHDVVHFSVLRQCLPSMLLSSIKRLPSSARKPYQGINFPW